MMAQNAAGIKARQESMKAMGGAMKDPGGMAKGETAFDHAKVQASLKTIEEQAVEVQGPLRRRYQDRETDTLPAAFENKADLMAKFDKTAADAKAARRSPSRTKPPSRPSGARSGANCGACHKAYRKPRPEPKISDAV